MNKVIISGNLTKDPELRYTSESQMAVCTFNMALNRGKDKDGNDRGADFPRVVVYGRTAENCDKYLAKGRKVLIEGRIHTGSYQNKDGATVYTTDVIADRVEFMVGSGTQEQKIENTAAPTYSQRTSTETRPEDIQVVYAVQHETPQYAMIDEDIPF